MTAVEDDRQLWPNGEIFYELSEEARKDLLENIRSAMKHIEEKTLGAIRFVERKDNYANMPNFIYIERGCECHYDAGGMRGGKQILSLGLGCEDVRTVIHELLHAVGLYHEHQRPDRDQYVKIHEDNIRPDDASQFVIKGWLIRRDLSFDYKSIMLYDPYASAKNPSRPTMTSKTTQKIWRTEDKTGMSELDVRKVLTLYPRHA